MRLSAHARRRAGGQAPVVKQTWRNERGLALVITLFVVALVAVLVLEYHFDAIVELDLAANYANDVQAYHLAMDGVRLAQVVLQLDDTPEADGPKDLWFKMRYLPLLLGSDCFVPQQLLDPALLGGLQEAVTSGQDVSPLVERRLDTAQNQACIRLLITDEGSKLPVNALTLSATAPNPGGTPNPGAALNPRAAPNPGADQTRNTWISVFEEFFKNFQIDPEVVDALIDWSDDDDTPSRTGGIESSYYERLPVPYKAKNSPMSTPAELRLVKGLGDPETLAKLFPGVPPEATGDLDIGNNPYLTPFPYTREDLSQARVNLNTASLEVLLALFTGAAQGNVSVTRDTFEALLKKRLEGDQFADVNSALEALQGFPPTARTALTNVAAVTSSYFRVESEGHVGVVKKRVVAVIQRTATAQAPQPTQPPSPARRPQPTQPPPEQSRPPTKIVYFKVE